MIWNDGSYYIGDWFNDQKHGAGLHKDEKTGEQEYAKWDMNSIIKTGSSIQMTSSLNESHSHLNET